jgi:type II secretory pathway pseudopilin PulG
MLNLANSREELPTKHGWRSISQVSAEAGFTIAELIVGICIVMFTAASVLFGLLQANKFGGNDRNYSSAKALCQEVLEYALTVPYNPPDSVPSMFGSWPVSTTLTQTFSQTVPVYEHRDDSSKVAVPGTRTLQVARVDTTLNVLRLVSQVSYTYRGKTRTFKLETLRAPN